MHTGRQFRRTKLENTFPIVVRSLSDWPFYMHRVLRLGNHSWLLLNGLADGTNDHCGKCQCRGGRCLEQDVSICVSVASRRNFGSASHAAPYIDNSMSTTSRKCRGAQGAEPQERRRHDGVSPVVSCYTSGIVK
jgi:hypothetical protein